MIADENFARFSDPLLQACLLRAAKPAELNYLDNPAQSLRMSRLLTSVTSRPLTTRGGPTMEVLVALVSGRLQLKQEHVADILNALDANSDLPDHIEAMKAYARTVLKT